MPIFDFHCHFSFKPAASTGHKSGKYPDPDHWKERFKRKGSFSGLANYFDRTVVKSSQLHGDAATEGGFSILVNSLYPLERGFTTDVNKLVATLTGYDLKTVRDIRYRRISNFDLLEREYHNLLEGQKKKYPSAAGNRYKVVNSYNDIVAVRKNDPKTICIINSIEGAHAFSDRILNSKGKPQSVFKEEAKYVYRKSKTPKRKFKFESYLDGMMANIDKVKTEWRHTPFIVTFAHHYYNHLCGHSPSLPGVVAVSLPQTGNAPFANVKDVSFFELGMRRWAPKVLAHLLRRTNAAGRPVRRILIDIKHMSPQARLDYYDIVDKLNRHQEDHIPIVMTHTGISGRPSLRDAVESGNLSTKKTTAASRYFYTGMINLFDDEIDRIVSSDGLIGLMIDERRIMGEYIPPEAGMSKAKFLQASKDNKKLMRLINKLKHKEAWGTISAKDKSRLGSALVDRQKVNDKLRPVYLSVILRQIFHVLTVVGKQGWDHLAIGTDYDGVINPIDIYPQSSYMVSIKKDMVDFWNDMVNNGTNQKAVKLYRKHLYGKQPSYWIDKLLWKNGNSFLKKYYNDDYLLKRRTDEPWVAT